MEQSSAIKCPSISYHLVGTKKIQQELAKPKVLERYLLINALHIFQAFCFETSMINSKILCVKEKCIMDSVSYDAK